MMASICQLDMVGTDVDILETETCLGKAGILGIYSVWLGRRWIQNRRI